MKQAIIATTILCVLAIYVAHKPNQTPTGQARNSQQSMLVPSTLVGNQEASNTSRESNNNRSNGCTAVKDPEWWLVLIGLGGIIAAILTLRSMRESSERQLRAYVVTESGSIVNVANPVQNSGDVPQTAARVIYPNGPVAFIQIKNTGQTPAFHVRHWGSMCFKEFPLKSELPPRSVNDEAVASILGPGLISTKRLGILPILTTSEISELMNGTAAIYVYGEILYRDAFGFERFTNYRLMHHNLGGPIGVSTDLSFAEGGNEAN